MDWRVKMKFDMFSNLNEEQAVAVKSTEGYYRVIAGAGSGKTRALTHRYAHLIENFGISPENILCVTYTNKAAKEIKKRIRAMIGDKDLGYVCTFHGFAVRFLREDIHYMQYPKEFLVLDDEDQRRIINSCFTKFGITSKQMTVEDTMKRIWTMKDKLDYLPMLTDVKMTELSNKRVSADSLFNKVWFEYLYIQRKNYGLDFQDLLNFMLYILINDSDKKKKWQERLNYIMVDEVQDVDTKELAIAKILSAYHKNLFVVGDPDQTIYEWRRARVETILEFDDKFSPCTTIEMNKNYRSTAEVINPANALIKYNNLRFEKEMYPIKTEPGQAVYFHAKSITEEAGWISDQIIALKENGTNLSDIAVLYRAHHVSRTIEEAFIKNGITHILYSGVPFYGRKEIKNVLSYLRMLVNADDLSFERIINEPNRGIGKTRIKFLQDYAEENNCSMYNALIYNIEAEQFKRTKAKEFIGLIERFKEQYQDMTLTDLLLHILKDSGYEEQMRVAGEEDRLDNLAELKQSIFEYETTAGEETNLHTYLQHIALFTGGDRDSGKDAVNMMTIHSAKGLEFPYVFVCGMNEGIFPSRRAGTERQLEEERRLAYVAFTRAETKLFLSDAEGIDAGGQFRYPSRFIFNAEKVNLEYIVQLNDDLADETQIIANRQEQRFSQKLDYKVGDNINHEFFGIGVIIDVDEEKFVYIIKFDGINTPRRINSEVSLKII